MNIETGVTLRFLTDDSTNDAKRGKSFHYTEHKFVRAKDKESSSNQNEQQQDISADNSHYTKKM